MGFSSGALPVQTTPRYADFRRISGAFAVASYGGQFIWKVGSALTSAYDSGDVDANKASSESGSYASSTHINKANYDDLNGADNDGCCALGETS